MSGTILVAGQSGQLARALAEAQLPAGLKLVALGRPELDILNKNSIHAVMDRIQPGLVVNAAAYTAVDQAESDEANAFALNETAPAQLAAAAAARSIPIIHVSTDYVFDGSKAGPYSESDPVAPLGIYGRSKLAGERAVAAANPDHLVLRTAWVYSVFGKNFVKTMLRAASQRDELTVVDDQIGNPTSAHDLADAIVDIAAKILADRRRLKPGTYHLSGTGAASWADFADAIFEQSQKLGGPVARVRHIPSRDYPTPVTRPANSRLDCSRIAGTYNITLPAWQDSMRDCVGRLIESGSWVS